MEKLEIILEGCRAAKRKYQELLYEQYYDFALKIVFRYIYNYEEAAEVTNDGFVKFFLSLDKFVIEKEGNIGKMLGGWIRRIMVNTAIDLLRKKMMLPEIGGIPDAVWEMEDNGPSAEQKLIYKELGAIASKARPWAARRFW